jgi:hypothetical protein
MSIEDLFRTRFTDPAPMSFYDPLFGEEEMVALQAARPRLEGRTDVPIGATGLTGAGIVAAGQREASRATALGDMVAQARGQRIRATEAANLKRIQEIAAAESAGRQQQARAIGNIMAGVGQAAGSLEGILSDKKVQAHFKGLKEQREARKLEKEAASRAIDRTILPQMRRMKSSISPEVFGAESVNNMFGGPTYDSAVGYAPTTGRTATERLLADIDLDNKWSNTTGIWGGF